MGRFQNMEMIHGFLSHASSHIWDIFEEKKSQLNDYIDYNTMKNEVSCFHKKRLFSAL